MNKLTSQKELQYNRFRLLHKARASNYNPEVIKLTLMEIDNIPCITEREVI